MAGVISKDMSQESSILRNIPIYVLGFIIVGIFMGGIYSLPAMRVTKSTDPWLTILLSIGLTISVTTIGIIFFTSYIHVIYAILTVNILLITKAMVSFAALTRTLRLRLRTAHGRCYK